MYQHIVITGGVNRRSKKGQAQLTSNFRPLVLISPPHLFSFIIIRDGSDVVNADKTAFGGSTGCRVDRRGGGGGGGTVRVAVGGTVAVGGGNSDRRHDFELSSSCLFFRYAVC